MGKICSNAGLFVSRISVIIIDKLHCTDGNAGVILKKPSATPKYVFPDMQFLETSQFLKSEIFN